MMLLMQCMQEISNDTKPQDWLGISTEQLQKLQPDRTITTPRKDENSLEKI